MHAIFPEPTGGCGAWIEPKVYLVNTHYTGTKDFDALVCGEPSKESGAIPDLLDFGTLGHIRRTCQLLYDSQEAHTVYNPENHKWGWWAIDGQFGEEWIQRRGFNDPCTQCEFTHEAEALESMFYWGERYQGNLE